MVPTPLQTTSVTSCRQSSPSSFSLLKRSFMKTSSQTLNIAIALLFALFLAGCGSAQNASTPPAPQAKNADQADHNEKDQQKANIAKLNDEDRPLAEAQGYCAVTSEPLGSMGPPLKLLVNEQAVFVCCKSCEKKARSSPDKTLAKVEELKSKVKSENAN